ncbi:MAG: cyclic pyranopterin phosphate synthase MoaA [Actinobacteria bacterium RBG_16_64_13]|nr:MAG: cyclic pyranopterin phosphate synthase MoaA [Actinobacteria bacterium RBG_16_64_13]
MNPPAGQSVDYLRLSVTDRCNYRCVYCMPPEGVPFRPHQDMLSYEDMEFFVRAAVRLGISKVRVTGGEPLVRKGLPDLVALIRAIPGITDISLTTNGALLPRFAEALKTAGLDRVNISLDSLDPERYRLLTRGGSLPAALKGVEAALRFELSPVKLNVVMMPELLPELPAFVAITRHRPLHVRFIEWMPVGGCGPRAAGDSLTKAQLMAALRELGANGLGEFAPADSAPGGWGPAHYYRFEGYKGTVGFIGSVSDHFCRECNRLRLTADGRLKNCLFSSHEIDAKSAVQARDLDGVLAVIAESLGDKTFDKNVLPGRTARGMSQVGG